MLNSFIEEYFEGNAVFCLFTFLLAVPALGFFFCNLKINFCESQLMRYLRKKYPEKYDQYIKIRTWAKIYRILKENRFENDALISKIRKKVNQYDMLKQVCMCLIGLFLLLSLVTIGILQSKG